MQVFAEIRQPEDPIEMYREVKGIIISGSPSFSAFGEDSGYTKDIYDLPVPILGFCFGHQEIAKHYGGRIVHGGKEWGHTELHICAESPVFKGLGKVEQVWMSHFDTVTEIGPDFEEIGYSKLGNEGEKHRFAAIASDKLKRYGFQYHPEVDDTVNGETMIRNFVLDVCGCRPTWTMGNYVEEQVRRVRERVGDQSVFLLASGGIDSTVCAVLLGRALGPERLHLLHVDNGLMRKDESRGVIERFKAAGLGTNLHFIDASEDFLKALAGIVEPEKKRLAIGNTFIEVFEREARRLGLQDHLLGQGTIYPDTIETGGTKRADTIKTHHNRVPLIEEMIKAGRVIEPLSDLYKVEVRELGVRLLCNAGAPDTAEFERIVPEVKAAAAKFGVEAEVLPIRSVGVKADLRAYEHPVLLSADKPWEKIVETAGTIFRDVYGVNRCVWNLGGGAPKTFEPLAATITRDRLDQLREADALVMDGFRRHGIYDDIWQCPTVMVPLRVDGKGREFVIVRPIHSERAMTARPARLPEALIAELKRDILALPGISGLALDVTSKPPGTIEWE
jgi:GMP synthase (glutamine-hydrolysing)